MENGVNRLPADFVGVKIGPISRDAIQAAWTAMTAKGKQKGRDLVVMSRIREAILDDQTVEEKTGAVSWSEAALTFRTDDDFGTFAKAVEKMIDDDGVEFGLSTGALELQAACNAKAEDLKAAKKAAEVART
jgi:hypothetical protein